MRPVCKKTGQCLTPEFRGAAGSDGCRQPGKRRGVARRDPRTVLAWGRHGGRARPTGRFAICRAWRSCVRLNWSSDTSALWRARIIGVVGLLLAVFAVTGQVFEWKVFEDGQTAIALASWGRLPYVFIVIGMALGLAQLELVLRASREPVRHKLKFVVIGLGGLAGYQIYQASQMLLFPVWQAEHVLVSKRRDDHGAVSDRLRVGANPTAGSFRQYLCVPTGPLRLGDVHRHRALPAGGGGCR